MPRPYEPWPADDERSQGRSSAGVVVACAFSALTMAYGLVLFQPPLTRAIDSAWARWSENSTWVITTIALGTVVGAGSLALMALSSMARAVQRAPFIWSAPLLAVISGLALFQLSVKSPLTGVPASVFVLFSILLMLVGGSLLQIRSRTAKLCGALLLALPSLSLLVERALGPGGWSVAWTTATMPERSFALITMLTALGMALLSLATGRAAQGHGDAPSTQEWRELLRNQQRKLTHAQHRAKVAESAIATFDRPRPSRLLPLLGASVLLLLAVLVGAYFNVHEPLLERARLQQKMLATASAEQRIALEVARRQWAEERVSLEGLLSEERRRNSALLAEDRAVSAALAAATTANDAHASIAPSASNERRAGGTPLRARTAADLQRARGPRRRHP